MNIKDYYRLHQIPAESSDANKKKFLRSAATPAWNSMWNVLVVPSITAGEKVPVGGNVPQLKENYPYPSLKEFVGHKAEHNLRPKE